MRACKLLLGAEGLLALRNLLISIAVMIIHRREVQSYRHRDCFDGVSRDVEVLSLESENIRQSERSLVCACQDVGAD